MHRFEKVVRVADVIPFGWGVMSPGRSMVTFCKCCESQRVHQCTGELIQDGEKLARLECIHCRDRLAGKGVMQ